jgi:hypothetical protein
VALRNWSSRRIAVISISWVILTSAYCVWREFSTVQYRARLRAPDIEGFVMVTEGPPLIPALLTVFVPPFVLLVLWGRLKGPRS